MKGGWIQAEDLYVIIIFFENIVKNTLESPWNLAENPLENPEQEFHSTVGHPVVGGGAYLQIWFLGVRCIRGGLILRWAVFKDLQYTEI